MARLELESGELVGEGRLITHIRGDPREDPPDLRWTLESSALDDRMPGYDAVLITDQGERHRVVVDGRTLLPRA